ncbi:hypothetical protein ACH42_15005 [Endozoicomonas sp. (ex Bugula neritina AB1)]|nr:hypothetical protein ACH42_15005 [Endozoicomonas sp. (ex Bugula neritina AB1)]
MPPDMNPETASLRLAELRVEIEAASEAFDWELVAMVDRDIRLLAEAFPQGSRTPALSEQLDAMKVSYGQIFADSKLRKKELRKELGQMRDKREALDGYKNSLAAGNRELRTSA